MKQTIVETDIKADYSKYVYFCSPDKNGNLTIVRADRSSRSQGKKDNKKEMEIKKDVVDDMEVSLE